jgi:hypothetical protein
VKPPGGDPPLALMRLFQRARFGSMSITNVWYDAVASGRVQGQMGT